MNARTTTQIWTSAALRAFAANSLLTRQALRTGEIDWPSFTLLGLASGAVMLGVLTRMQGLRASERAQGPSGALWLFAYAGPFTLAYVRLGAATGALILFGVVQLTMMGTSIARGERPRPLRSVGLAVACEGLAYLGC